MRRKQSPDGSYTIWLTAHDVDDWKSSTGWASGHGRWPCSTLPDRAIWATFDASGDLVDMSESLRKADPTSVELNAIFDDAADYLDRKSKTA